MTMAPKKTKTAKAANFAFDMEAMRAHAGDAARLLKALANEKRLQVLCLLAEGERSVTELENILSLRQPTVSQQLARLRLDDLVTTRRDGKTIYYSLANDDVRRVISVIYDMYCGTPASDAK